MTPQQQSALAAADAAIVALTEAHRVLRASLADPVPAPPPAEPPPAPAPEPARAVRSRALSSSRLLLIEGYAGESSAYTRSQAVLRLSGDKARVRVFGFNMAAGAPERVLTGGDYTLLIDGLPAATMTVAAATVKRMDFAVDATKLPPGWHWLDVTCTTGETCIPYAALVVHGAVAGPSAFTPVSRASYELAMRGDGVYHWADAPPAYAPVPRPLALRTAAPFSAALPRTDLHCTQLVPLRFGDTYRPAVTKEGALTSAAAQPYHWHQMASKGTTIPLLDGPRGVGTVCMTTHLQVGRNGGAYFCDHVRMGHISADGTVKTLVGTRHRQPMSHWQDPPVMDLVGDWSAVPVERRGCHELWGMAWWLRTLATDEAAQAMPNGVNGMEKPHTVGPVCFLADSQNNRVLRVEFDRASHATPAKVTEFLTGLGDPWDVVCAGDELFVSERTAHRIAVYSAETGAFLRVLVQGSALAVVDRNREVTRTFSLAECQAAACVAPEGLYLHDGHLYFGSKAQAQVRRIPLAGGDITVVATFGVDGNTKFCKFSVSDGTTGPAGTVFIASWSNRTLGMPDTILPNGGSWKWWDYAKGGVGAWAQFGYPTAVASANGRILVGGINEGVLMVTAKQPGDSPPTTQVMTGRAEFFARGLDLLHGDEGFGYYGISLPWGESPAIDAFLAYIGHRPA